MDSPAPANGNSCAANTLLMDKSLAN
jgi:hypothetical protein